MVQGVNDLKATFSTLNLLNHSTFQPLNLSLKQRKNHIPHQQHQQCKQEHQNGNAVDAMHIFHPLSPWTVRVGFFDV